MKNEEVTNLNEKNANDRFNNEDKRQLKRREKTSSSRFLDNYYNPEVITSRKSWWPNGVYILKKKYIYSEVGLCCNYEKNNTLQKLSNNDKSAGKTKLKNFLEYDLIEENEFIITIEYCSNCDEHQTHTQHSSQLFKNFATSLQRCIMMRFPFIKVLLKPIDTDINVERNASNTILNKTKVIDYKYKEVRIGAMEVQLCSRVQGPKVVLLHSKLESGTWPSISNVLNSIVAHLPRVDIQVKIYDKEDDFLEEEESKKDLKGLIKTKVQNINMVLYRHKNKQIEDISNNAKSELDIVIDPKKRKEMILTKRKIESMNKNNSKSNSRDFSLNPLSANRTNRTTISKVNFEGGRTISSGRVSAKSNFMSNKTFQIFNNDDCIQIRDKDIINSSKGEQLISLFTNENGIVTFKGLPYDSFLIEVAESSNFQTSALIINFKQIQSQNESHLMKYIGLYKQLNAFIRVNVTNEKKEELVHISNAEVLLHHITPNSEDKILFEEQESKVKLVEKPELKRYEAVVVPGKYNLEVNYNGFDISRKQIHIHPGENIITVNMLKEKKYNLKVNVFSYEKFSPIENVLIKLKYVKEEEAIERITDSLGASIFEVSMKEDFMTIYAEKLGFFPCQRTYIRDVAAVSENSEVSTREIIVILIKESFIMKENCMVLVTYSNLIGDNFEPVFLYSNAIGNYTDINCGDSQTENGILTSYFKYHAPSSSEREQLNDNNEEELEEIIRLIFKIKTKRLQKEFKFNHNVSLNGLQRFSCESCLYTPNNMFYINSPCFSREQSYEFWDMGYIDIKNVLFYEVNLLNNFVLDKNSFFYDWTSLLQLIIDTKVYSKLFEFFEFDKGQFLQSDRFLYEPSFLRSVRKITNDCFSPEFMLFFCDIMKAHNKMISYSILKKKISSNLKNFRENFKMTLNGSLGHTFVGNK